MVIKGMDRKSDKKRNEKLIKRGIGKMIKRAVAKVMKGNITSWLKLTVFILQTNYPARRTMPIQF